jgi:hypothetical protein
VTLTILHFGGDGKVYVDIRILESTVGMTQGAVLSFPTPLIYVTVQLFTEDL